MEHAGGTLTAVLIGVWATFALDVYSTLNSSPQTTELFAKDREDTLVHWVKIGGGVAIAGGAAATVISGKPWPLIATVGVAVMMWYFYMHAVKRGQGQAPPAESGY